MCQPIGKERAWRAEGRCFRQGSCFYASWLRRSGNCAKPPPPHPPHPCVTHIRIPSYSIQATFSLSHVWEPVCTSVGKDTAKRVRVQHAACDAKDRQRERPRPQSALDPESALPARCSPPARKREGGEQRARRLDARRETRGMTRGMARGMARAALGHTCILTASSRTSGIETLLPPFHLTVSQTEPRAHIIFAPARCYKPTERTREERGPVEA